MTLFTYLDHRYRTLNIQLQSDYTLSEEGELKAAYAMIQYQRTFYKYFQMPFLLTRYILINLHLMKSPIPVLEEKKTEDTTDADVN